MQQVLFNIPFFKGATIGPITFPPDGLPVAGFGAMLFVTFILVTWWGTVRARTIGMPGSRFQDFAIWLFFCGIIGARVLYMIQYAHQFPDHSLAGLAGAFFKIWEGGIIFYGSALGGAIGYGLFYWFVLRRLNVSGWQLADAVAPLLALGLAIGRIGCYLNGCCWGQVACEACAPVPLGPAHFPLLPAHARGQLVTERHLQTTTGFAIQSRSRPGSLDDPRPLVTAVEKGSPADKAGVQVGDRVARVNGEPTLVLDISGPEDKVKAAAAALEQDVGVRGTPRPDGSVRVGFKSMEDYRKARGLGALADADHKTPDRLEEVVREWPRGKSRLVLSVERDGKVSDLPPFAPATVGLYPTQLYETVSMLLLILVLLAYYPYRRHDGQLMVLVMLGYSVHRFINESLRIEPSIGGTPLTLSQWGSVVIFLSAVAIEAYLWRVMPSRWKKQEGTVAGPLPA